MQNAPAITEPKLAVAAKETDNKLFVFNWASARLPLFFLLCMSLLGLSVYPVLIVIVALLAYAWKTDRYDALVMLLIFTGGYHFYGAIPSVRAVLLIGIALLTVVLVKKTKLIRRSLWAMAFYIAGMLLIARHSIEPMSNQILIVVKQFYFLFYLVVLIIFAGKEFDFNALFRRLFPYCIIICIFYCLDFFIIGGYFLLPGVDGEPLWDPDMAPFTFRLLRHRPPGLYLLAILLYPMAHGWKMPRWCWVPILGAVAATQTFTVLTGLIVGFVIAQGSFRKYSKNIITGVLFFVALYCVDSAISGGGPESKLRVRQQVDQLFSVEQIQDEEDLAEMGTGRMAQALPKLELLYELDMEWFGFGFLHPERTTNPIFFVYNPFYSDVQKANELATGVEISSVQLLLNAGYVGLAVHIIWLVWLWMIVRKRPMARCFLTVVLVMLWFGIGGYTGMNMPEGQLIAATIFGGILLQDENRPSNIGRRHDLLLRRRETLAKSAES